MNTMTLLSDQEIERLARKRAGAKMGWYIHATVYLAVNALLLLIASAGGHRTWPLFPALGWGLGLAIHGAVVFLFAPGNGWTRQLVERERAQLQRRNQRDPW
jgi:hypothetical protein